MNVSKAGWVWHGYPGHFILADRCAFHLSTSIHGRYLVSTVGHLVTRVGGPIEPVGGDANFETMVFETEGFDEHTNPRIVDLGGVETFRYDTSNQAEDGHYAVCNKYNDKFLEVRP